MGREAAAENSSVPLSITIANTGSGHNFPTGFPEGRTAWLAIHAYDLATRKELPIKDNVWNRVSIGVGNLTTEEMVDPNFPGCNWKIPAGSADPYSMQFKAVASLGDGCPTLDLPYASPLNLVTNKEGMPIDEKGTVIDQNNSRLCRASKIMTETAICLTILSCAIHASSHADGLNTKSASIAMR